MKNYPLDKYKYKVIGGRILAISSYAGKRVIGRANCAPEDSFDEEKGKKLAAYRCNEKVAVKRLNRARRVRNEAMARLNKCKEEYESAQIYFKDAFDSLLEATTLRSEFEENLK